MNKHYPEITTLIDETKRLQWMSHRVGMNDFLYLDSRRKQTQKCLMLLERFQDQLDSEVILQIRWVLKYILLENWTRQLFPSSHGVIPPGRHKTESYLNKNESLKHDVLEPRNYIGIDPEAFSDLDAPSIVTALTPAKYCQPEHSHSENYEVTFYAGPSLAKFRNNGEMQELSVWFWDFAIIPPGTIHSIENHTDAPVMNISIKLPWALKDRGAQIDNRIGVCNIQHMVESERTGIYEAVFPTIDVPYTIGIYDFSAISDASVTIESMHKSAAYVISGDYIGHFSDTDHQYVLQKDSTIILDGTKHFIIDRVINPGVIYQANLLG
jgi:cupin superfamily acireductone dioxygenase involved in methionine salvage